MNRTCVILVAVAPLLAYRMMRDIAPATLIDGVAAIQAAALCWLASSRLDRGWRLTLAAGAFTAVLAGLSLAGLSGRSIGLVIGGLCHAAAYLGLLVWFAASLLPGREPVVTGLARRIRQTMPERVVRYTRKVTIAWCVFFLAQLATSAVLLAAAPEPVWSAFVEVLNLPLVAAMVLAEFGCRLLMFRHETRSSLGATIAAMRDATSLSGDRP